MTWTHTRSGIVGFLTCAALVGHRQWALIVAAFVAGVCSAWVVRSASRIVRRIVNRRRVIA